MVSVKRLNGQEFVINCDLIETMESTPDTVITLTNGKKYMVQDKLKDIIKKIILYKQMCNQNINIISSEKKENTTGDES